MSLAEDLASRLTVYHNVVNLHLETEISNGESDTPGIIYKYHVTDGSAKEDHYGLSLAKTLNLPTDVTRRAQEVSYKLKSLQEKARRQSESSKVVARRRVLAQIAHHVVLIQQAAHKMSRQELVQELLGAQQEAIAQMLPIGTNMTN